MEKPPQPYVVRFGEFEVDRRSRELRRNGLRIKLHEQPFRVLELLLQRPGELITRQEIQREIWPADTFVDFDRGLNTAINRLRQALGDSAAAPRFIETLPRRGYRFMYSPADDAAGGIAAPGGTARRSGWTSAALWLLVASIAIAAASWAVARGRARIQRRPVDPEAYEAYRRGRYVFWHRKTGQGLDNALREFTRAIEKAPDYAPAYAAVADCYSVGMFNGRPLAPADARALAAQAATRALQLDPDLGEAHRALANVRFRYDWNWADAEREYKRAIELDPNDAQAYREYAVFLSLMKRTQEGEDAARRAEQLDPLSTNVSHVVSLTYVWARRFDDGIQHVRKTLELDPNFGEAHSLLARSYEAKGMWADAVSEWLKDFALNESDADNVDRFRRAFDRGGIKAFWRAWLEADEQRLTRGGRPRLMELARLSYLLEDKNASFAWLERAYQERDPGLPNLYWAADWLDGSRSDPRYVTLAHRMGLPQ